MSYVHTLLGQSISWSEPDRATHRRQDDLDSTEGAVRTGVVWSHGPDTDTAWVIPDNPRPDEGHAVCVAIHWNGEHKARELDIARSTKTMHELGLWCLRHRASLPPVLTRDADGRALMGYDVERGA